MIVDLPPDAVDLARAWAGLMAAFPDVPLVKITLGRKTGQWFCSVGRITAVGTTEAEAIAKVAAKAKAAKR